LVADVVVVVGVVGESDIDGPDSLEFGAADASAVAPMMAMPARQLVAKSLRIMIHTLFQARTLGAPHLGYVSRAPSGSNARSPRRQQSTTSSLRGTFAPTSAHGRNEH